MIVSVRDVPLEHGFRISASGLHMGEVAGGDSLQFFERIQPGGFAERIGGVSWPRMLPERNFPQMVAGVDDRTSIESVGIAQASQLRTPCDGAGRSARPESANDARARPRGPP